MGINKKRKKKKRNETVAPSNVKEIENNGNENKETKNTEEDKKEKNTSEENNEENNVKEKKDNNLLSDVVIDINKNVESVFKEDQRIMRNIGKKDKDKETETEHKENKESLCSDYLAEHRKQEEQKRKYPLKKTAWMNPEDSKENEKENQSNEYSNANKKKEDSLQRKTSIRFNEQQNEENNAHTNIFSNLSNKHFIKAHSISNFNNSEDLSNEEYYHSVKSKNSSQKRKMKHHRNKKFIWKNKNTERPSYEYLLDSIDSLKELGGDSETKDRFSLSKYISQRKEKNKITHRKTKKSDSFYINDKVRLVKFLCYTKSYDVEKLYKVLLSKKIQCEFFDEHNILCVFLSPEGCVKNFYSSEDLYKIDNLDLKKNVTYPNSKYIFFIFKNGSVVIWENFKNYENNDYFINKITLFLNAFSNELLPVYLVQLDTLFYSEQSNSNQIVSNGIIYLAENNLEQKLTVSFALSQSIRLDVHEIMMDIAITTLFNISKDIASTGTCNISKKKVSSMLHIYSSTINVNAVQDFLDIPEYFWNKVQYEHLWFELYKYLEIPERIKILNKRYNYYKDFLKVITTELYNKKTFHCYWIIVWLLFVHVIALILNDIFFSK